MPAGGYSSTLAWCQHGEKPPPLNAYTHSGGFPAPGPHPYCYYGYFSIQGLTSPTTQTSGCRCQRAGTGPVARLALDVAEVGAVEMAGRAAGFVTGCVNGCARWVSSARLCRAISYDR